MKEFRTWLGVSISCFGLMLCVFPALGAQLEYFPGIAAASGYNNTLWRSEAVLFNRNDTSENVTLQIIPRDQGNGGASRHYTLEPGEMLSIPDIYGALFAGTGAGTLKIDGGVTAWVRTFNQGASGTFGFSVPGASTIRHEAGDQFLFPTHKPANINTEFRSNLLLLSLADTTQAVHLLMDGIEKIVYVEPWVYTQINNIGSWMGAGNGDHILRVFSDGVWSGYLTNIDPFTGDSAMVQGKLDIGAVFNDDFDAFTGWTYAPESSEGSAVRAVGGYLSASSLGCEQEGCGPVITKALAQPIDLALQDFAMDVFINSPAQSGRTPDLEIQFLDQDGTPVVGIAWGYDYVNIGHTGNWWGGWDIGENLIGKLTLRADSGSYTLLYNGDELGSRTKTSAPVISSVKIRFAKYSTYGDAQDIKLDFIRVTRR